MKYFILLALLMSNLLLFSQEIDENYFFEESCDETQIVYSNQDFVFDFMGQSTVDPPEAAFDFTKDVSFFFVNPETGEVLATFNFDTNLLSQDYVVPTDILNGLPDGPVVMYIQIRYMGQGSGGTGDVDLQVYHDGDEVPVNISGTDPFLAVTYFEEAYCFTYVNCGSLNLETQKGRVLANIQGSNGPFTYQWYVSYNGQSYTFDSESVPQFPGCAIYSVFVTNTENGCQYYDEQTICTPEPEPCLIGTISGGQITTSDGGYNLTWNPAVGAASYIVTIFQGDPFCCKDAEYQSIQNFTTTATSIDFGIAGPQNDCFSYSIQSVCPNGYLNPPSVSCYTASLWDDNVDSRESEKGEIFLEVFPNPAVNYVEITLSNVSQSEVDMKIYDFHGNEVFRGREAPIDNEVFMRWNCSEEIQGLYFIQIETEKAVIVQKVIVNK